MQKTLINNQWYFAYGKKDFPSANITLDGFSEIGLPHSFGIPCYGDSAFFVGYGQYIKKLHIEKNPDKLYFLEFGGVFCTANIEVNGILAGSHSGGYTSFCLDITECTVDGENIIVVTVDNFWNPTISPRAGEHTFNGGIYRGVNLIEADLSHIDYNGIAVTTLAIQPIPKIQVKIKSSNCIGKILRISVQDAEFTEVAFVDLSVIDDISIVEFSIPNATLWSPETPYLYNINVSVGTDKELATFGIRTIRFTKDRGFFLNEIHYWLEGVNAHQDRGGWGDAGVESDIARDISLIKGCGFNFVRGSHYPHHPSFAKECDKQGLLFWSECTFWGIGGFREDGYWDTSAYPTNASEEADFLTNVDNTMKEMISANINSPSIITWSVGNEIFFSKNSVIAKAKDAVREIVKRAKKYDPSRPISVGGTQRKGFDTIGDLTGYNGDGAVLYTNPSLPNVLSEYGSVIADRPGKLAVNFTEGSQEKYPWRCGRALWCAFHHGSIANIGNMGIIDFYRIPLNSYYAYRQMFLGIAPPAAVHKGKAFELKMTADKLEMTTDGTDDIRLCVSTVDTSGTRVDSDISVTLEVISGGGLLPSGKIWIMQKADKTFLDGIGAIEIRAYYSGEIIVRATAVGLTPVEITLSAIGGTPYDGRILEYPPIPFFSSGRQSDNLEVLKDRPIKASSHLSNHSAALATDDNNQTFWQANGDDTKPSLTIDMENLYTLSVLEIVASGNNWQKITVYSSLDGITFGALYCSFLPRNLKHLKLKLQKKPARWLRISFSKSCKIIAIKAYL